MIIDIFLVVSVILIIWLGWSVGLTRTFFAVLAGFVAVFAASKYPYQEGLNFYVIFVITALFIIMLGGFILRMISFFYLSILDRIGGAVLSVCVWLIVAINVVIPTMTHSTHILDRPTHTIYTAISHTMQSKLPIFKDYVLSSLERKVSEHQSDNLYNKILAKGKISE
ncbi:MAG: hypothetical protein LE168_03545 [Endomicrobium sp.]|nr:hypothetical protein [Endomicrobium sp.]